MEKEYSTQEKSVLEYYANTKWDYENLWFAGRDNCSVHFGYYDESTKKHKAALLRINEVMSEAVDITEKDNVVDAGCGYGESSIWLAKNIGCRVTGLNIVPFQVDEAVKKIKKDGLDKLVDIRLESYDHSSLSDASCSVFWGLESIVHSENREKTLREAHRLLATDGRLVIAEYLLPARSLRTEEQSYLDVWLKSWSMPSILSPQKYEQLLTDMGFKDIKICTISKNIAPSLRRLKHLCRNVLPMAKFLGLFYRYKPGRLDNLRGSRRQVQAFEKGLWEYCIVTAVKI